MTASMLNINCQTQYRGFYKLSPAAATANPSFALVSADRPGQSSLHGVKIIQNFVG
jgi:hypothetical protein